MTAHTTSPQPFSEAASALNSNAPLLPPRPRLVLRMGFAGRKDLTDVEKKHLDEALREVLTTVGERLLKIAPGTGVPGEEQPRVAQFYSQECALLRLVTGLCEGGDSHAHAALRNLRMDSGSCETCCLETELGAVLAFPVDKYRESRPAEFRETFDQQLAECSWVLELDGIYGKPDPDTELAKNRRSRAYRAQSTFLLRQSDVLIAAADPSLPGKAGGTLETVREAQIFELPVVFIHLGTGAIYLIAPEENMHSVLSGAPKPEVERNKVLERWVNRITLGPADEYDPGNEASEEWRRHGVKLLEEFFDDEASPRLCPRGNRVESWREFVWTWFVQRFDTASRPWKKRLPFRIFMRVRQMFGKETQWRKIDPGSDAAKRFSENSFSGYRKRSTELNYLYSGLYRGAFFLNYVFAIMAVSLAATSLVLMGNASGRASEGFSKNTLLMLAIAKLLILIFIYRNTSRANKEHWNDRAVDYRYLAERLRAMLFLPQAGSYQPPAAAPPQFASRVVRQSAVDWLLDAIVRSASPLALNRRRTTPPDQKKQGPTIIHPDALANCETIREKWIEEQAKYHEKNASQMHRLHRLIEEMSSWLGIMVMFVVGIDMLFLCTELLLEFKALQLSHEAHDGMEFLRRQMPWLVCIATVLPAVVAALGGVRFQSECQRLAERSAVMRVMLGGRMESHRKGELSMARRIKRACTGIWVCFRRFIGWPPVTIPPELSAGLWKQANDLHDDIKDAKGAPMIDLGSWSCEVLGLAERVATELVQEAAEWSVLYAKEVSEPG